MGPDEIVSLFVLDTPSSLMGSSLTLQRLLRFDLNEIFADYFISEFENPMDAYTSSMANYQAAAAAGQPTAQAPVAVGGWHII